MSFDRLIHIIRIPTLLFLLLQAGSMWARPRPLFTEHPARDWIVLVTINLVFMGVVLLRRGSPQLRSLTAVEAALAAVIAVVPPWQWTGWFGVNSYTQAAGSSAMQPLAAAWLAVVIASALRGCRYAVGLAAMSRRRCAPSNETRPAAS